MIPGLNTLRILAEFAVVTTHVTGLVDDSIHHHITWEIFIHDLMSFFFILSGCVTMLNGYGNDGIIPFWSKKLSKVGWVYYICLVYNNLYRLPQHPYPVCALTMPCLLTDFILVSQYINCGNFVDSVIGVGWYLSILVTFWVLFPFLQRYLQDFFDNYAWLKITGIYLVYNALILVIPFNTYSFAPIRLFEFIMGCGLATTIQRPLPIPVSILAVTALGSFYILHHYFIAPCLWMGTEPECNPFAPTVIKPECTSPFYLLTGKASIFWVIIIHTVAARELLDYQLSHVINPFSLFVYMCHIQISGALVHASEKLLGLQWEPVFLILLVYYLSYLLYLLHEKYINDKPNATYIQSEENDDLINKA